MPQRLWSIGHWCETRLLPATRIVSDCAPSIGRYTKKLSRATVLTDRQLALPAASLARAAGATGEHLRGRGVGGRQVGRSGRDAVAAVHLNGGQRDGEPAREWCRITPCHI